MGLIDKIKELFGMEKKEETPKETEEALDEYVLEDDEGFEDSIDEFENNPPKKGLLDPLINVLRELIEGTPTYNEKEDSFEDVTMPPETEEIEEPKQPDIIPVYGVGIDELLTAEGEEKFMEYVSLSVVAGIKPFEHELKGFKTYRYKYYVKVLLVFYCAGDGVKKTAIRMFGFDDIPTEEMIKLKVAHTLRPQIINEGDSIYLAKEMQEKCYQPYLTDIIVLEMKRAPNTEPVDIDIDGGYL